MSCALSHSSTYPSFASTGHASASAREPSADVSASAPSVFCQSGDSDDTRSSASRRTTRLTGADATSPNISFASGDPSGTPSSANENVPSIASKSAILERSRITCRCTGSRCGLSIALYSCASLASRIRPGLSSA